jgi:Protein of unknown function (DUF2778)
MSTSTGGVKTQKRRNSRKASSPNFIGHAAIACLVLGCGYTVYSNVLGASIYPSMDSAAYKAPVVRPTSSSIARSIPPSTPINPSTLINDVFAEYPDAASAIEQPVSVAATTSIMFNERFAAYAAQSEASRVAETTQVAAVAPQPELPKLFESPRIKSSASASVQVALASPTQGAPSRLAKAGASARDMAQRAKAAVMGVAGDKTDMVEKLWGKAPSQPSLLAFASADVSVTGSVMKEQNPMLGGSPPYDRDTAVYDISAKTVYLPDGTRLEAHSGLGSKMDDVRYAHVRMQGVTPPHIYTLKPREALFHGVPALRLTPIGGEDKIFGRDGLLAHTYMLGGTGQSNGCVSFKDYYAFLDAYRNKGIRKIAVLAKVQ